MVARRVVLRALVVLCVVLWSLSGSAWASEPANGCPNATIRSLQQDSSLPECRAYEMVSPVEKEGANIAALPGRTQSAQDGNSIMFFSKAAFGDAIGSEQPGAEYIAARGGQGWPTHSVNPEQGSKYFAYFVPSRYVGVSPDLSKGVFFGRTPVLAGHPNVEGLENLYLRTDLQTPGAGSYELLSDAFAPLEALKGESLTHPTIVFDWASADWRHVVFESYSNLTSDTGGMDPTLPKVYEWHDGVVTFAGVLPDSACVSPPCLATESVGGNGGGIAPPVGSGGPSFEPDWTTNSISADGSRIVFEAGPFTKTLSGFSDYYATFGDLYMRIDKTMTVQLNASERQEPDPRGHLPARFLAATPDDSKVLFETEEGLTNDAEMPENNVYMYNVDAPAGEHLTLISVDHEPSPEGGTPRVDNVPVPAISGDGSFVYFFGRQRLIAGQAGISQGEGFQDALFVWHNGTIRLVTYHIGEGLLGEPRWGEGSVLETFSFERGADEFRMSADGRKIVFATTDKPTAESAGLSPAVSQPGLPQIYVYDYATDKITCASCNPSGALPTSRAGFETKADGVLSISNKYLSNAMSRDGRYVFFDTGDPLVAQDTNGRRDVYEYDTVTGEVHLLSDGTCACDATFAEASPDGSNVFFTTRQRLTRVDVDRDADLYDVRVNGGILAQNVAPPASCVGEECRGPALGAPVFSTPSSATFAGAGNPPAPSVLKVKAKRKRPTLAQALRACKQKPKKQRSKCQVRVRKAYHANRATRVQASRRAGR
jgi:Tol biopolymer transport system component